MNELNNSDTTFHKKATNKIIEKQFRLKEIKGNVVYINFYYTTVLDYFLDNDFLLIIVFDFLIDLCILQRCQ